MIFDDLLNNIGTNLGDLITTIRNKELTGGLNLRRSVHLPLTIALQQQLNLPILFITDRNDRALSIWEELNVWNPSLNRAIFAEPNNLFYENVAWGDQVRRDRLSVLAQLARFMIPGETPPQSPPFIVSSIRAVMTRTIPRREFLKATKTIKLGSHHSIDELTRLWSDIGYERVNTVIEPGQYSRRGGILDIWITSFNHPLRIEFFGDEIESMRAFDPTTQRTIKDAQLNQRVIIPPAREFLLSNISELSIPEGEEITEFYLPQLHPLSASLLDYLPQNAMVILDNLDFIRDMATEIDDKAMEIRRNLIKEGKISEDTPPPYLSWSEMEDDFSTHTLIHLGAENEIDNFSPIGQTLQSLFTAEEHFAGRLRSFIEHLQFLVSQHESAWVITRQKARLEELWQEQASHLPT
ncbi:MAG: hypothetical protein ACPL7A_02455, partial [Anaerolineales bacterium]